MEVSEKTDAVLGQVVETSRGGKGIVRGLTHSAGAGVVSPLLIGQGVPVVVETDLLEARKVKGCKGVDIFFEEHPLFLPLGKVSV